MLHPKPASRPGDPRFSCGPCKKRPGWSASALRTDALGRIHRWGVAAERLNEAMAQTRALLAPPADWALVLAPGSDTGAVEMALWNLLGPRPVDVFAWEAFSKDWAVDAVDELQIPGALAHLAPFGQLPDLGQARAEADLVFAWNGTTSGVRTPNADWIAADREGLAICDATSAAFAMPLDWGKFDVVTFSFQKALGGEAQHGILALGPRALARLCEYAPERALPKVFRLRKDGAPDRALLEGAPLNTPSLLVIEDWLDALGWAQSIGGLAALHARTEANFAALSDWVARSDWAGFLAAEPASRSPTSVCLSFVDPRVAALPEAGQRALVEGVARRLEAEKAAYDVRGYRAAPPGLRVWCGPTVDAQDVASLGPWLDWAYHEAAGELL